MITKTDWIKSQLLLGESINVAASRLNTPITIPNPVSQPQISIPIDLIELRKEIPDLEAFKVLSNPIWINITDAIKKGDNVTIVNHMKALLAGGLISPETITLIAPLLQQTQPDPNWKSSVLLTPAQLAGFDPVLVSEVQIAQDNVETATV